MLSDLKTVLSLIYFSSDAAFEIGIMSNFNTSAFMTIREDSTYQDGQICNDVDRLVVGDVSVDVVGKSTRDVGDRLFEGLAQFLVNLGSIGQAFSKSWQFLKNLENKMSKNYLRQCCFYQKLLFAIHYNNTVQTL